MRSKIVILQTNMFRSGTIANTDWDSSELSDMAEGDEFCWSYDLPHNNWLTPDTVSAFGGHYMIWCE